MLDNVHGDWRNPESWLASHPQLVENVLARIRAEGGLRSSDFENHNKEPGGWWNWKEEKQALEHLLTAGFLMVARRDRWQRVYDLRERIRPDWDDAQAPARDEVNRELVLKASLTLGAATPAWLADYFRLSRAVCIKTAADLAEAGQLLPVEIEGLPGPVYLHPAHLELAAAAIRGEVAATRTSILSPFDPLVWDRARARALFGFDFSIEFYLPQPKRSFGYYAMPILYHDALVGRIDAKSHRDKGVFEVKALALEEGAPNAAELAAELAAAVRACAFWHGAKQVIVSDPQASDLAAELAAIFGSLPTEDSPQKWRGKV
jgi:uncharacterized protein YcaQ